jgi:hypothetical protein
MAFVLFFQPKKTLSKFFFMAASLDRADLSEKCNSYLPRYVGGSNRFCKQTPLDGWEAGGASVVK